MRGLAVLTAAAASWMLVTRSVPLPALRIPRIEMRLVVMTVVAFVGGSLLAGGLLGVPAASAAVGFIVAMAPATWATRRRLSTEAALRDRWPDVLMYTRSAIASGAPLEDAFCLALEKGGAPFEEMADEVRTDVAFGGGFRSALDRLREDLSDATADRVLVTLSSASVTGGRRVGDAVALLASSVADEVRLRKAHDASMTEQRWTVNVALLAPWVLLGLAIATNPQAKIAYASIEGAAIIAVGLAATLGGWILARRSARLERAPRVFR